MRTNSIAFHLISLAFTGIGLWMFLGRGDAVGLVMVLFFGGGWVATQGIRLGQQGSRPMTVVGGVGALALAAGCGLIPALVGRSNPWIALMGVVGALLFGAGGVALLVMAFRGGGGTPPAR